MSSQNCTLEKLHNAYFDSLPIQKKQALIAYKSSSDLFFDILARSNIDINNQAFRKAGQIYSEAINFIHHIDDAISGAPKLEKNNVMVVYRGLPVNIFEKDINTVFQRNYISTSYSLKVAQQYAEGDGKQGFIYKISIDPAVKFLFLTHQSLPTLWEKEVLLQRGTYMHKTNQPTKQTTKNGITVIDVYVSLQMNSPNVPNVKTNSPKQTKSVTKLEITQDDVEDVIFFYETLTEENKEGIAVLIVNQLVEDWETYVMPGAKYCEEWKKTNIESVTEILGSMLQPQPSTQNKQQGAYKAARKKLNIIKQI